MYTEEEIKKYLEILHPTSPQPTQTTKSKCKNCGSQNFVIDFGHYLCEECGQSNGHVLGYFDLKEYERFYFRKKSVYQRKYHYEKKIKQITNLSDEEQYLLFKKLMGINGEVIKKVNKKFSRKRMINILYIIKRILEEMGLNHKIHLNISYQTKDFYDRWWESYLKLRE